MAEESDGIEEAFEGQMRMVAMTAARAGEMFARAREDARRRAQQSSEREARELTSRLEAEKLAARAQYADVQRSEWWDRATPDEIGQRFQTARAWQNEDPEAARAEQHMRGEIKSRYGIDVPADGRTVSGSQVTTAVQGSLDQDRQAAEQRRRAEQERAEAFRLETESRQDDRAADEARSSAEFEPDLNEREQATVEAAQRDAESASARNKGEVLYDSAERRDATAQELSNQGVSEKAIAARMHEDKGQAKPPIAAVKDGGPRKAPSVRKAGVQRGGPQAQLGR